MNFNQIKFGKPVTYLDGVVNYLKGAMIWGFRSKYKWSQTTPDIWGFANPNDIDPEATAIYNRIIADGGVSDLTRLNYFVVGLKTIYATLTNVPVCYDAHWIGYKLGSGTGATAGQAAAKLYSLTVAGDAVQATAASQPLLLSHNGASSDNYYYCSGVAGNYCSTTTSKTFTNFTFNTKFNINTTLAAASEILGRDFIVRMNTTKTLDIISLGGVIAVTTTAFTYTVNTDFWIRITRVGTVLKVFSSTDGINYTQKDSDFTVGSGSITITNSNVAGFGASGAAYNPFGKIYYVTIDGILDFNPAQYNAATSQTAWTSSTGEVWTISTGTAATGYKGVLVDRTIVQSDGVDDIIGKNSAFTSTKNISVYSAKRSYNVTDSDGYVTSGANPGDMTKSDINFGITGTLFSPTGRSTILQFAALRQSSANTSKVRYNANADTSGTPTTTACSRIILFGSPYAWDFASAQYSNNILNTVVLATSYDDDSVSTATYNLIRSLNNNAF